MSMCGRARMTGNWVSSRPNCAGVSCFLRDGDRVFHTYSTFARGTDQLGSSYTLLDLTALGRRKTGRSRRAG